MPWLLLFYSLSNGLSDPFNEGNTRPWVLEEGEVEYGSTDGLRMGLGAGREVITGGLSSLVSPELMVSQNLLEGESFALAVHGGLGVPTFGLRLVQGMWFPGDVEIPWAVVGAAGVSAAVTGKTLVYSGSVHARVGLPQDTGMLPMDHPWLDSNVVPLTEGWGLTTRVRIAWLPKVGGWEVSGDGRIQWVGGPDLGGRLLVHRGVTDHWALGLGVSGALDTMTDGPHGDVVPILDFKGRW